MSTTHHVWQFLGPGSGHAFAESQRGLSESQQTDIFLGRPLSVPPPEVDVRYLSEGSLGNVIGSSFSAFVVSPAVQELIGAAAPAQFVAVRLPHDSSAPGYAILNVLAHVDCFDRGRSDWDHVPGRPERVLAVRRLVLRGIPLDAPAIFHVGGLPGVLLVRTDLRAALEGLGGVGEFVPIAHFRWGLI